MQHKKTSTRSSLKLDKLVTDRNNKKSDSFAAYSTEFDFVFKRPRSHEAQSEINEKWIFVRRLIENEVGKFMKIRPKQTSPIEVHSPNRTAVNNNLKKIRKIS